MGFKMFMNDLYFIFCNSPNFLLKVVKFSFQIYVLMHLEFISVVGGRQRHNFVGNQSYEDH